MKVRTPVYLMFGGSLCVLLAAANYNGWSLLQTLGTGRFAPSAPATRHK
jgi:hypothetical protein